MQDIHSVGGGFFTAGGGGDRRLRPHHHQNQTAAAAALKCPRCDSLNTKFCYYNNYNLSQPRHFCKNCRRYWTKGGVLRNVPIGGGCRKTKRSKPKSSSATSSTAAATTTTTTTTTTGNTTTPPPPSQERKSNSHSSSESSSLTATTTATATEAVSAPPTSSASNMMKINQESKFFMGQSSSNPSFEVAPQSAPASLLEQGGSSCGIFSEIGSFTSLIASSAAGAMPNFEYGSFFDVSISPFRLNQNNHHQNHVQQSQSWHEQSQKVTMSVAADDQELKMQEITGGLLDQTGQVDLSVMHDSRSNGGGFGSLGDWQQCGDQGFFDLSNTVDQPYWSQSQWTDQDQPSLYMP